MLCWPLSQILSSKAGSDVAVCELVLAPPTEPGPYTVRVKVPLGVKLMPHWHREDRIYTVISGVFYVGLGDQFDADKLVAFPPGAVIISRCLWLVLTIVVTYPILLIELNDADGSPRITVRR